MLRDARSHLRLLIAALCCAVLVTSFAAWALSLHAGAGRFTWVKVNPSRVPAANAAELWHVSASCVRPYLVRAALRSKAKLEAHYNAAPVEVRARLNARTNPDQSVEPAAWHPPDGGTQRQTGRSDPYGEYVAALQVKYAEWYAALFKLEIEAGKWQQRLLAVADQTLLLSAASRASFGAYSRTDMALTGSQGDFDAYLLTALGLGGFSSDEQMSLKSACISINPVVESFHAPNYLGRLWHWPLDCLAEFSFGLELVLISIFFAPIAVWIGTGDLEAKPQIRTLIDRLGTSIRDLNQGKLVCGMLERVRKMDVANLVILERVKSYAVTRRASTACAAEPEPRGGPPATAQIRPTVTPPIEATIRHD